MKSSITLLLAASFSLIESVGAITKVDNSGSSNFRNHLQTSHINHKEADYNEVEFGHTMFRKLAPNQIYHEQESTLHHTDKIVEPYERSDLEMNKGLFGSQSSNTMLKQGFVRSTQKLAHGMNHDMLPLRQASAPQEPRYEVAAACKSVTLSSGISASGSSGIDSFFVSKTLTDGSIGFGVTGGEIQFVPKHIPNTYLLGTRDFSAELCKCGSSIFETTPSMAPVDMLTNCLAQSCDSHSPGSFGGASAVFGKINSQRQLELANLGTTWVGFFRNGSIKALDFNPKAPLNERMVKFKKDKAECKNSLAANSRQIKRYAKTKQWDLNKGDIVIMATKGFMAAMPKKELSHALTTTSKIGLSMQQTSFALLSMAQKQADRRRRPSSDDMLVLLVKVK